MGRKIDSIANIARNYFNLPAPEDRSEWICIEPIHDIRDSIVVLCYILYPLLAIIYIFQIIELYFENKFIVYWYYEYEIQNSENHDKVLTGRQLVSSMTDIDDKEYKNVYKNIAKKLLKHFLISTSIWIVLVVMILNFV